MAKAIPDHLRHLPIYKGLPVAWVACWSGEQGVTEFRVDSEGRFNRDRLAPGVIAGPGGIVMLSPGSKGQGRGTPDFGATQSFRQRSCMTRPRCQVCGRVIEGVPYWIVPHLGEGKVRRWADADLPPGVIWTKQPPVCVLCRDTAPD